MSKDIYLDNSATTKPYDEVVQYIYEVSRNFYGNPSSLHTKGIEAENLVKKARFQIATVLKADSKEIFFTSGGTESNNMAIMGYLRANPRAGKHIITSEIEHPSVMEVFKHLESEGFRVNYIPVDQNGIIKLDILKEVINKETALLSFMYTNNEVGANQPIAEIDRIRKELSPSAVLHIDAVQAFGKTPVFQAGMNIDLLSISAHKIHGPKGIGALYIRKGIKVKPILLGGGQETALRSGTENVPGICGFGLATEMIFSSLEGNFLKAKELKQHFIEKLKQNFEDAVINSSDEALPYIINVSFPNLKSEVLLHHLEQKNIYVSTGSACSSHKSSHSHVLKAMGVSPKYIDGAIRFSLSAGNTMEELDETINALKEIIPVISIKRKGKIK
ncbi:MAG: cysteine desulfurase family protein [Eubacterium sp.]|jgi:cysteine desulfurase|nr:cysteine desulfurase family protein [Eubacterium sp.]